jgi:stage IV sporulation protein FB
MLGMPATTQFDLNFRLLGIPVRINPFFWVLAAALGWESHDGWEVLIWIGVVFVSILVHEFGHGLTARALSPQRPTIVLYGMGGLCFSEREQRSPGRRLAVILMGPGAGFLLFGLIAALGTALIGITPLGMLGITPLHLVHQPPAWVSQPILVAYHDLLWINLFWGLFNLFPIYPLDGGQAAQALLTLQNRHQAMRRTHILSMVTAAILAVLAYQWLGSPFTALFVGYLGLINFQLLQAAQFQGPDGGDLDDDDWWRR